MKIQIDKSRLMNAFGTMRDISNGSVLQILNNTKVETKDDNAIILTASDLDVTITSEVPCNVMTAGATTLPTRFVCTAAGVMSSQTLLIDVPNDNKPNAKATLSGGETSYNMATLIASEFPETVKISGLSIIAQQADIKRILRKTSYATSKDETRKALNGVMLAISPDGKMTANATDGRVLAIDEADVSFKGDAAKNAVQVILGIRTVKMLQKMLSSEGVIEITIAREGAIFKTKEWTITTKVIDDFFPNVKQVIPSGDGCNVDMGREELIGILKEAMIAVDETAKVKFDIRDNALVVSSANGDISSARSAMPVKYDGERITFTVNANYLMQMLTSLTEETVRFSIYGKNTPIRVAELESDDFIGVVMPIRDV